MQTISVTWKGKTATIRENEVLPIADAVEEVVTFGDLIDMRRKAGSVRFAKLARAYAAMLTEAGIPVTAAEVHQEFTGAMKTAAPAEKLSLAVQAIDSLIVIVLGGAPTDADEGDTEGNVETPA